MLEGLPETHRAYVEQQVKAVAKNVKALPGLKEGRQRKCTELAVNAARAAGGILSGGVTAHKEMYEDLDLRVELIKIHARVFADPTVAVNTFGSFQNLWWHHTLVTQMFERAVREMPGRAIDMIALCDHFVMNVNPLFTEELDEMGPLVEQFAEVMVSSAANYAGRALKSSLKWSSVISSVTKADHIGALEAPVDVAGAEGALSDLYDIIGELTGAVASLGSHQGEYQRV